MLHNIRLLQSALRVVSSKTLLGCVKADCAFPDIVLMGKQALSTLRRLASGGLLFCGNPVDSCEGFVRFYSVSLIRAG